MFTGLVADMGEIVDVERTGDGARLTVATRLASDLRDGDSVAVDGVCLTAAHVDGGRFSADVVAETLRRSSLGDVEQGARVNLELPLRAADRLGGHVVQGHVDGVGTVVEAGDAEGERSLTIAAEPGLLRYVVEKGSIAVDGVSLTVASLDGDRFAVALIPETVARTGLGAAQPGTRVNLEVDVLAKYVERLVASR